jgi:uncharacterized protein (DUF58 family)
MKNRAFPLTLTVFLAILALASGSTLIWQLLLVWLLLLPLNYLWVSQGTHGIRMEIQGVPENNTAGESFKAEFTVFNHSILPKLLVEIRENSNIPGYLNQRVINLKSGGSCHWPKDVRCRHRGRYSLGQFTIKVSDPFSFFCREVNLGQQRSILIYPPVMKLPFQITSSRVTPLHGNTSQTQGFLSPDASRVREYNASDSMRHIHWRSTAHTGRLMVKVFEKERPGDESKSGSTRKSELALKPGYPSRAIWIILDMFRAVQTGNGEMSTAECTINVAAALARRYADSGSPVGLMARAERLFRLPPEVGEEHLKRLLEVLALMNANDQVPVAQLIAEETEYLEPGITAAIITPAVDEHLTASLRQLSGRGLIPVVVFIEPTDFPDRSRLTNRISNLQASGVEVHVVRCSDTMAAQPMDKAPLGKKTTTGA